MTDRNKLIEENLHHAATLATRMTFGAPKSSPAWQDAYSVACLALVEAADDFDPSRGAKLITLAWMRMVRAIQRLRIREKARWGVETIGRHTVRDSESENPSDLRDICAERDEFNAALVASPEELLIEAEERIVGADRFARLVGRNREIVERVLDGRSPGERVVLRPARIAEAVGLRLPAKDRKRGPAMSAAERSRLYYARMSPEERALRNARKSEARRRKREAQRAGVAA